MYKDYTIKARISSSDTLEEKLSNLNPNFIGIDQQTDTYFQVDYGKLKLRQGTIENLITHYERTHEGGAEKTRVYRYDLNPTPHEIQELKNSHQQIGVVQKQRKIYLVGNVKIHLDKLRDGEEFIELEAIDRDNKFSSEELKKQCLDIKNKLGIRESDQVQTGYFKS